MQIKDTICAIATAQANGAVGMIRISGSKAQQIGEALSGKALKTPRKLYRRAIYNQKGEFIDDALIVWMKAPASYTAEDVVELFGHGGMLNLELLLNACLALGARLAEPGEFTKRAFENGQLDLTQAEAVATIIEARSKRALSNAQALLRGDLGQKIRFIRSELIEAAADLEATLDFSDDVELAVPKEEVLSKVNRARDEVIVLLEKSKERVFLDGVSVALLGPVNVGKSSLFNMLLSTKRALVSVQPGTTRDYLEADVNYRGFRLTFIDTAGARDADQMGELEKEGYQMAFERVERADVRLHLVEADKILDQEAIELSERELLVISKADKISDEIKEKILDRYPKAIFTSTDKCLGKEEIVEAIIEDILPDGGESESLVVTEQRQRQELESSLISIESLVENIENNTAAELAVEHAREALFCLGKITGEEFTESILDSIFSRFCVGK